MTFFEIVEQAERLLRDRGRVSLGGLKRQFDLDDSTLTSLVEELVDVHQVAALKGRALAWVGSPDEEREPPTGTTEATPEPAARPTAPEAERRQLTVMFVDLVDSTELSRRLDAEDLRDVLRAYQESASDVIERYEGHVAQYLGDGLLVYFGYPRAHEDDPERAVRAGREILTGLGTLNDTLEAEHGIRIGARVGIHTGPVVVGEMGGGERRETLALGDTMNIAARIQGEAEPDTVVLSSATLRLVSGIFVTEDLGARALKGVGEVHLHRAVRASGMRSRLGEAAAVGPTPLVGRDQELGLLEDRFAQVGEGLGQVVLVAGEAGIGKSRLVQAFRERISERAHTWLECRCSPYTQDSALFPVLELQRQGLAVGAEVPLEVRVERLEGGLEQSGFELAGAMPLMASFLGIPLPERYEEPVLSPEARRKQTLELLVEWLLRLGRLQPLVLLMEDLHWVDPSTEELIGQVLERVPREQVLLLATYRPDFEPPWGAKSHLTPMLLARLTRRQLGDLIRKAARDRDLPEEWVEEIIRRSDGVPLFAEELTKTVLESNPPPPEGGEVPTFHIPETLQDSLTARIDQLGPVKEIAQLGSVLGREFSYDLLLMVSPLGEEPLRRALADAVTEELFYQRGTPPDASYLFKHALIRDAAYQSMLRRTRQRHHRRVAEALSERVADVAQAQPEVVAHHFAEAGEADRAIECWAQAAERAAAVSAQVEAVTYLERALRQLETLPDSPERSERELSLQVALGASAQAVKGWGSSEVEAVYRRARELCGEIHHTEYQGQVLWGLISFHQLRSDLETSTDLARELLALGENAGDPVLSMMGHVGLEQALLWRGEYSDAAHQAEATIALYDAKEHRALAYVYGEDPGISSRAYGALVLWCLGYPDRAEQMSREAMELGRRHVHPLNLAFALSFGACARQLRGERDPAKELAEQAIALSAEQGFPVFEGGSYILRGWALTSTNDDEQGLQEIQLGLAQLAVTGTEAAAPLFLSLLVDANRNIHRAGDALGALGLALAVAEEKNSPFWSAELFRLEGELMLLGDESSAEAEPLFRQAIALAREQSARSFELRAATSLAHLWQREGKKAEARNLLPRLRLVHRRLRHAGPEGREGAP